MYDNDWMLLLHEQREGNQMLNVNYADDARRLSDGELSAVVKTYQDEQARRAAIRADKQSCQPNTNGR